MICEECGQQMTKTAQRSYDSGIGWYLFWACLNQECPTESYDMDIPGNWPDDLPITEAFLESRGFDIIL